MIFLKGIIIGIIMMIPGLSGGSTAMILKVYDRLLQCMSNLFNFKNLFFLFKIFSGITIGIVVFSFVLFNFTKFNFFSYLVIIILILNIGLLLKEYKQINFLYIVLLLLGYTSMLIIKRVNYIHFDFNLITYILIGLLLGVSLVLPGLGATYVLYSLNLYDTFNTALTSLDYHFLLSISFTTLIGIILSSKIIHLIITKDKFIIYSIVIGLLIGGI